MPTVIDVSNFGSGEQSTLELTTTKQVNQVVWQPWWRKQLQLSEDFLHSVKKRDFEQVAKMINVDFAKTHAVNVNY